MGCRIMSSATEVFALSLRLLQDKDMAGFIDCFDEDGTMEFPFAPPGQPQQVTGHAAMRAYALHYPDLLDIREIKNVAVYETPNVETLIAEYTAAGAVVATGQEYEARYIAVMTIRAGRIQHYREYWNPLQAIELLDGGLVKAENA
jgi:uncharacterized protein